MFREGYHKIMWGLILILIDIRIGGLDIVPDFIGYFMIVSGLGILSGQHDFYKKAKPYALVLVFFSFLDLFEVNNNLLGDFTITPISLLFMGLGHIGVILRLFMLYYICNGIVELAENLGLNDLKESAAYRWKVYLVLNIVSSIFTAFMINIPQRIITIPLVLIVISLFITEIFIITLIKQGRDGLGD